MSTSSADISPPSAGEERRLEPGSFRDRDSRVFYGPDGVFRGLSEEGLAQWRRLAASKFFAKEHGAGRIVATEEVEASAAPVAGLELAWAGLLRHERIPFVSYPYEWCFGMLKDAAALQLDLLTAALSEDMTLKDATPYNVQWRGARPTFIDVPSFVELAPGDPWEGYRQFCELQLYPLMLQAYKGVPFHAWLRGAIDGISPNDFRSLMSWRDVLRAGVLKHVVLHAALQSSQGQTKRDVRDDLKKAGFHKELILANVRSLRKLVGKLEWKAAGSEWANYTNDNSYDEANRKLKEEFVGTAVRDRPRKLVWDLGCNTGDYSRIAAEHADAVVAMDGDHLAIENLYRRLRDEESPAANKILPLVMNLNDASPNLGWRGAERKGLPERGRPDMTLCLALIHHVVISAHVPLQEFVGWLADMGTDLVIEFVDKNDEMTRTLLRNKEDKYADYEREVFEECLSRSFEIVRKESLQGGTRTLYHGRNQRAGAS